MMLRWLRRKPLHIQVLVIALGLELLRLFFNSAPFQAFWRGLTE